jgi:UDP-2,4-diacetamido-2,4,6-trideoxy-beta-L-altropyranose hydrolase
MSGCPIVFCTAAGPTIGLGHLRRCITLAQVLKGMNAQVHFLLRGEQPAIGFLEKYGFSGKLLEESVDWGLQQSLAYCVDNHGNVLVIDSYPIEPKNIKGFQGKVVVIDDLCDRSLPVELILNGSVNGESCIYQALPSTKLLLGPQYILLRDAFSQKVNRLIQKQVDRILITMGGMDSMFLISKLIQWTRATLEKCHIDLVFGPFGQGGKDHESLSQWQDDPFLCVYKDPTNLYDLMMECDIAITGGGQTTYELAATGTPALAIQLADNQIHNLEGFSRNRTLNWVGCVSEENLQEKFQDALSRLARSFNERQTMSKAGPLIVDGCGAPRVAQAIKEMAIS